MQPTNNPNMYVYTGGKLPDSGRSSKVVVIIVATLVVVAIVGAASYYKRDEITALFKGDKSDTSDQVALKENYGLDATSELAAKSADGQAGKAPSSPTPSTTTPAPTTAAKTSNPKPQASKPAAKPTPAATPSPQFNSGPYKADKLAVENMAITVGKMSKDLADLTFATNPSLGLVIPILGEAKAKANAVPVTTPEGSSIKSIYVTLIAKLISASDAQLKNQDYLDTQSADYKAAVNYYEQNRQALTSTYATITANAAK